jgi:serine/threonine protein kinase
MIKGINMAEELINSSGRTCADDLYDHVAGKNINYSCILDSLGLNFTSIEYYWQVGNPTVNQGWILDLSVVRQQFVEILTLALPLVIGEGITFKIARDSILADSILEGKLGMEYLGKMISIYPENDQHAIDCARKLIFITNGFKGPEIPTARYLGGCVYTRYGSFKPIVVNGSGELPNSYTNPFVLPKGISWPFESLIPADGPKRGKLLHERYYPISTIKEDTKGRVIKAIYFKGLFIASCVIKEARQYVLYDDSERDIRNRLRWQYELYNKLATDIPMPAVVDYFEESGNDYLVMDFVKGIPYSKVLRNIFQSARWVELGLHTQSKIIEYLLRIINVVKRLHSMGYIHRDITPENFMIDKKERLWLIDIELMFSITDKKPLPAYALGTPGFISPEQQRVEIPTLKEDVYAMGALILTTFTNLPPTKFETCDPEWLKSSLFLFTQDDEISHIIAECLNPDPSKRPELAKVEQTLERYHERLKQNPPNFGSGTNKSGNSIYTQDLRGIVQGAILGLGKSEVVTEDLIWFSRFVKDNEKLGNEPAGQILYEGWHTGISGVLWVLAIAVRSGFDITNTQVSYEHGWEFISQRYLPLRKKNAALYTGSAGIAVAFSAALKAGMLPDKSSALSLEQCFSEDNPNLTIAEGIAGQGIALLKAAEFLPPNFVHDLLTVYNGKLVASQKKDGSWPIHSNIDVKQINPLIFEDGVPGIIWFLLCYMEYYPTESLKVSIHKGLHWLMQKSKPSKKSKISGGHYIALVFIKAYEVMGDDLYRNLAVFYLSAIPAQPVFTDFTLGKGFAGLGEVYLDAYRTLKDPIWLERAEWIAQVLINASRSWPTGERYWVVNSESWITADLFAGNSGIIHFLMRYLLLDQISHPLAIN